MADRPRQDSSRDLLEELEDGWATTPSNSAVAVAPTAERGSTPNVNELDEGWLDQLFPEEGDEEDEDDHEEDEELPDERLDPVAFAAAKKAQAERIAVKKERKRVKLEAKRTRQRAKAEALRQKQKGKAKRKPLPTPASSRGKEKKDARKKAREDEIEREALAAEAHEAIAEVAPKSRKPSEASRMGAVGGLPKLKRRAVSEKAKASPSTMQSVKLLAIVLAVLLAIAAAVAVLAK